MIQTSSWAMFRHRRVVYRPQEDQEKMQFLEELSARRQLCPGLCLVLGYFNLILQASDKNNANLEWRVMGRFKRFVDHNGLKELYLHGHRFRWSNEWESPTLTKIDRVFVSVDWEMEHPDCFLQALSTAYSDHCTLHLALSEHIQPSAASGSRFPGRNLRVLRRRSKRRWSATLPLLTRSSAYICC